MPVWALPVTAPPCPGGAAGPLLYRDGREYISFMSNDGLGLAADAHWQARVAACFAAHAPSASASRLAGGRSEVVDLACRAVADYFGFAECLFLPSGYQANLACVTTLLQQGQEAFVDRRCHASVMRALPLAGARIRAWNHLDYDHLERLLSSLPPDAPQPVVMAESLYSMDGAALDLERMAALRHRYGFFLCVDEAHALGALGPGGRGLCAAQALRDDGRAPADLVVGTLGKSLGLWGAFLLLPRGFSPLFEHLASAVMHSTALPPAHAACMLALVEELPRLGERRRTLAARVAFFRRALRERGCRSWAMRTSCPCLWATRRAAAVWPPVWPTAACWCWAPAGPRCRAGRPCCVSVSPPAIRKRCWPARLRCWPGCGKNRIWRGRGTLLEKGPFLPRAPSIPPENFCSGLAGRSPALDHGRAIVS